MAESSNQEEAKKNASQATGHVSELPFGQTALLRIMHQHHHATLRAQDQIDKAKKDAVQAAARVSELLVRTVNGGVEECFLNEKRIEIEIRTLINNISRYTKQTNQWLSASHAFNTALKEIGDFENWMTVMEHDCKNINKALLNIYQP